MKRNFTRLLLSAVLMMCHTVMALAQLGTPLNNEIWYTTTDGQICNTSGYAHLEVGIKNNQYSNGHGTIEFDKEITSIVESMFYKCSNLTSITIPNSVKSIGESAFEDCFGLTSITIPEGVTSIGKRAFYGCSSLTSITIPEGVTSIGERAFYSCSGLTSVTIPSSVTSIGESAFWGCSSLTSVTIPSSVTSIEYDTFSGCSGLTSVTIPSSVTSIGESAFWGCSSLTSVTIPSSVTSIGKNAFSNCSGLTSVTIPSSVTSIGESAFYKCSGLTSVTIPSSVTSIVNSAFYGCSSLTSITIPEGVTSIGKDAFHVCSGLTSVTIPSSVTSIGELAFSTCSNLKYLVVLPENPPTVGTDAFRYVKTDSIIVYVPNDKYTNWGGFTNFKGVKDYKAIALNEIDVAMTGLELTEADEGAILAYKTQINSASNLAAVVAAKESALAIIKLSKARYDALAEIDGKMDEVTTLTDADIQLINVYKTTIKEATTEDVINQNKEAALAIIKLQKAKDDALATIDDEMKGMTTLTDADIQLINVYKTTINEATTEDVINQNKEAALAIIKLQKAKDDALAAIDDEMKGMTTLTDADIQLINVYKTTINEATTEDVINQNKESALAIIKLQKAKDDALAAIDDKMKGMTTLTDADIQLINVYKTTINEATTEDVINQNKESALAIIELQKAKDDALAAIDNEMDGETSSVYLNGLVQDNLNAINNSDDYEVINKNRDEAINKIKAVIDIYKAGASETLGTLATPQAGCVAVKVTKGDKEVILYAPDKVKVIKIPANK